MGTAASVTICYLCGHDDFSVRPGIVRDAPELRVLQCACCGLVMLSSFDHIAEGHYQRSGMHGTDMLPMAEWLKDAERDDLRRFGMLKPLATNRKVLDFGCGAGGFLQAVGEVAAAAVGVEPEERVRSHWRGRLAIHARLEEAGGGYDLITAFHVVEHLPDPCAVLGELAQHLAQSGRLVVEVPNADDALLTLYGCEAFQKSTYWSQHLFLFNAATLGRMAQQAGLQLTALQHVQRYPLSNHLHWLAKGRPGGHAVWSFIDTPALSDAYAASLAAMGRSDTLIAWLGRT